MMKRVIVLVVTLAAALRLAAPAAAQVNGEVIYGADDRIDLYQTKDARLLSLADSTAALFRSNSVTDRGSLTGLRTSPYGQELNLCHDEPFYEQETGAFCSGSLVAPDILMTAGHCIKDDWDCKNTKLVFGFAVKKKGELPREVASTNVYGCAQILGREQVDNGPDWALIKLNRVVTGHKPLKLNRTGKLADKTPLVVIGHPAGLPVKIAGGASVRDASLNGFFKANLDTYGGNSGSAVFNAKTGLVEGILVRGETDYVMRGSCRVSKVCANDGCSGEDVTKIANVASKIPGARHRGRVAELGPTISSLLDSVSAAQSRP